MFSIGEKAYVISAVDWSRTEKIKIKEYTVVNRLSNNKVQLNAEPTITVNEWAIGKSPDEAVKIGVTFLIQKTEFKNDINRFTMKDYEYLEQNHSDLIFKYMEKVVEEY